MFKIDQITGIEVPNECQKQESPDLGKMRSGLISKEAEIR